MSSVCNTPEISVIITAWNSGRWIAETLRSVFRQSFQDFEVIVVDDGSTDETAQIVASFDDPRLRYVREENRGQSVASNVGAGMARGRFLKFLDADDLWNVQHLEAQYQAIRDCPGAIASCSWGYFREHSEAPLDAERPERADVGALPELGRRRCARSENFVVVLGDA